MRYKQHVDVMRYDDLKQILQVNGWLMFQDGRKYELEARVDGKKVPCKVQWGERKDVLKLWKGDGTPRQSGYRLAVHMGEDAQSLELWVKAEGIHQMIAKKGRRELLRVINAPSIRYCLDIKCIRGKKLLLQGWTVSCHNEDVKIQMEDETGRKVPIKLVRRSRLDVLEMFQGEIDTLKCGFNLEVAEEAEPFLLPGAQRFQQRAENSAGQRENQEAAEAPEFLPGALHKGSPRQGDENGAEQGIPEADRPGSDHL